MHRDDYRSAMNKVTLSDDARAALLDKMQKVRQGETVPAPKKGTAVVLRRWALPVAAALVLLAVPLGVYASGRLGADGALAAAPRASSAASQGDSAPSVPASSEPQAVSESEAPLAPSSFSQQPPQPASQAEPETHLAPAPSETGTSMPDMGVQFYSVPPTAVQPAQLPLDPAQEPQAAAEPPLDKTRNAAPGGDVPQVTEEIGMAKMSSGFIGRVTRADTLASGNPTRDLAQEALPTELPVYKTGSMDTQAAKEAVTRLANALGLQIETWCDDGKDGTLSGVSGAWTLSCTDSTITVAGTGVLLQRGADVKDADLGQDFAQRLASLSGAGKFAWEQLGAYDADKRFSGNLRLYVASSEGLEKDLYHYCFERLALTLDSAGNAVGLTASVPQLAKAQAPQALRPLADARAALDATLAAGQQVLHHELVYVHSETDQDAIVPSYKFTVATGESLAGYFTDGDASGYTVVRTLYVDALAAE